MSIIIAGTFESSVQAEEAAESLRRHHFAGDDVCCFASNLPDVVGAGVHVGSLLGVLVKLDGMGTEKRPVQRPAGVMVAARVNGVAEERTAIQVLHAEGASHIERVEGEWKEGRWADFDSVVEPRLGSDGPVSPAASPAAGHRDAGKVMVGRAYHMGSAGPRRGR